MIYFANPDSMVWKPMLVALDTLARRCTAFHDVLLLVSLLSAILGAAWVVSHPSLSIEGNHVISHTSYGAVLIAALVSGGVGLVSISLLIFFAKLIWYLLRGDSEWSTKYSLDDQLPEIVFELERRKPIGTQLNASNYSCCLQTPAGDIAYKPHGSLRSSMEPPCLMCDHPYESGDYGVRWYRVRDGGKTEEIARTKITIPQSMSLGD